MRVACVKRRVKGFLQPEPLQPRNQQHAHCTCKQKRQARAKSAFRASAGKIAPPPPPSAVAVLFFCCGSATASTAFRRGRMLTRVSARARIITGEHVAVAHTHVHQQLSHLVAT
jgi:hypothetical protein